MKNVLLTTCFLCFGALSVEAAIPVIIPKY